MFGFPVSSSSAIGKIWVFSRLFDARVERVEFGFSCKAPGTGVETSGEILLLLDDCAPPCDEGTAGTSTTIPGWSRGVETCLTDLAEEGSRLRLADVALEVRREAALTDWGVLVLDRRDRAGVGTC